MKRREKKNEEKRKKMKTREEKEKAGYVVELAGLDFTVTNISDFGKRVSLLRDKKRKEEE